MRESPEGEDFESGAWTTSLAAAVAGRNKCTFRFQAEGTAGAKALGPGLKAWALGLVLRSGEAGVGMLRGETGGIHVGSGGRHRPGNRLRSGAFSQALGKPKLMCKQGPCVSTGSRHTSGVSLGPGGEAWGGGWTPEGEGDLSQT